MKHPSISRALLFGCLILGSLQITAIAGQTNQTKRAASPKSITTNFVAGAHLTASEIKQVLSLARTCGIVDPSEIETFQYLPGGGQGISVKSSERVNGRNTLFDTVIVSKKDWDYREPNTNSIRVGAFWAEADAKHTTLLRSYEFKKTTIQISIGEGIAIAFADKVIPLIDAKQVHIDNDWNRKRFEELKDSKPVAINKSSSEKSYEWRFDEPSMQAIIFDYKDEQVVITSIADINI